MQPNMGNRVKTILVSKLFLIPSVIIKRGLVFPDIGEGVMSRFRQISLSFICAVCFFTYAHAISFSGTVLNQLSKPISGAMVFIPGKDTVLSGSDGKFTFNYTAAIKTPFNLHSPTNLFTIQAISDGLQIVVTNHTYRNVKISMVDINGKCVVVKSNSAQGFFNIKLGSVSSTYFLTFESLNKKEVYKVLVLNGSYMLSKVSVGSLRENRSSAELTAVPCTLWAGKVNYTTKSFPQDACDKSGLVLSLDTLTSSSCNPACGKGMVCRNKICVADSNLQHCVDEINRYRATLKLPPLSRSIAIEEYAAQGAQYDAGTGVSHSHFKAAPNYNLCNRENECPNWPLDRTTIKSVIDRCLKMMWDEGPGGGHYENMRLAKYSVGCGVFITNENKIWIIQDLK